jgi:VWFA-related protein
MNQWAPTGVLSTPVVALGLAAVLAARQGPAPTFRAGVELIQLDVSVLDKGRHPVHGLSAADFTVRVDGIVRPVVAFKAVTLPPPPPPPSAPWIRDVAPDVVTNTHPGGRAIVIMIDDATVTPMAGNLSPNFWMLKGRVTARRVVDELGADDVAAVVFTSNNHTAQGFTNDRARLLTAIDTSVLLPPAQLRVNTGVPYGKTSSPEQNGYCYCGVCSVEALANVAESLRSLPQQRKIIIYLSSGVGIRPDINDACNMMRREAQLSALRKAALANVTINPIDPQGFVPYVDDPDNPNSSLSYLRTMAESTGGRAVVNNNDMDLEVPRVLAESSSYYLLGVESTGVVKDGRFHEIDVRVSRPDLEVRTRKGYYDPTTTERKATAAVAASGDLDGSIEGVMPKSDFPMDVAVAPFADRQGTLAIVLGATQPGNGAERSTPRTEQIEVVASLFNPETGKFIGSRRSRLNLAWNRTDASAGYYEVLARLPVTGGRYEVRLGLKTGDARTASVYTFAEVPNFSGDALSLSGLVLNVQPAARVAPSNAFADLMPLVPTARRRFRATDRVAGFVRVYQKRWTSAAAVTMRITDERNAVGAIRTTRLEEPPNRATNGVDYRFDVPVAGLPKGEYLLSVDVEAGDRTDRRAARFTIE